MPAGTWALGLAQHGFPQTGLQVMSSIFVSGTDFWCTSSHKSRGPEVLYQLLRYVPATRCLFLDVPR